MPIFSKFKTQQQFYPAKRYNTTLSKTKIPTTPSVIGIRILKILGFYFIPFDPRQPLHLQKSNRLTRSPIFLPLTRTSQFP